jgi:hypothetical protein
VGGVHLDEDCVTFLDVVNTAEYQLALQGWEFLDQFKL